MWPFFGHLSHEKWSLKMLQFCAVLLKKVVHTFNVSCVLIFNFFFIENIGSHLYFIFCFVFSLLICWFQLGLIYQKKNSHFWHITGKRCWVSWQCMFARSVRSSPSVPAIGVARACPKAKTCLRWSTTSSTSGSWRPRYNRSRNFYWQPGLVG